MRFSDITKRLHNDGSRAWDIHVRAAAALDAGEDVIIMSVGDSEFDTPAPIIDACIKAMRAGDTHYVEVVGQDRLRRVIARRHAARTRVPVTAQNVVVCAGAQNALFNTAQVILSPGDEVVVLEPMYVTYEATLRAPGATLVPVPCPAHNGYRPDLDALRAAITPRTRAIAFANPVNPTGVSLPPDDLSVIATLAVENDLWVIADEVYADLVFDGEHHPIAALPGMEERAVSLGSLSKSHAMTGWRAGWLVGPRALVDAVENLALCSTYGLPGFVQQAAAFALETDLPEVTAMRDAFQERRDMALAALQSAPGIRCAPPRAGMFLILDVSQTGLSGGAFSQALFEACGVSVLDGAAFGPSTAGTVRLCFALPRDRLVEGCRRIVEFAASLA